jgi:transcription antitermination factor NusG
MMQTSIERQTTGTPWYVLQTRSKMEKVVATGLVDKGYEVFLPLRLPEGNRHANEPLFPCYLFCRTRGKDFGQIVSAPGAVRLLGRPGRPEAITEAELESVRGMAQPAYLQAANHATA